MRVGTGVLVLYICSTGFGIGIYEAEMSRRWELLDVWHFEGESGVGAMLSLGLPVSPSLSAAINALPCSWFRDPRKRKVARLIVHFCSILAEG